MILYISDISHIQYKHIYKYLHISIYIYIYTLSLYIYIYIEWCSVLDQQKPTSLVK